MGWLFSISLFIAGGALHDGQILMAAGLFAIAGAISFHNTKK